VTSKKLRKVGHEFLNSFLFFIVVTPTWELLVCRRTFHFILIAVA